MGGPRLSGLVGRRRSALRPEKSASAPAPAVSTPSAHAPDEASGTQGPQPPSPPPSRLPGPDLPGCRRDRRTREGSRVCCSHFLGIFGAACAVRSEASGGPGAVTGHTGEGQSQNESPLPCLRPSWGLSRGGEAQGESSLRVTLQPGSRGALWEGPVPPGREPTVPGRHPGVSSEPTGPHAESSLWEPLLPDGWDPGTRPT